MARGLFVLRAGFFSLRGTYAGLAWHDRPGLPTAPPLLCHEPLPVWVQLALAQEGRSAAQAPLPTKRDFDHRVPPDAGPEKPVWTQRWAARTLEKQRMQPLHYLQRELLRRQEGQGLQPLLGC